jgi:hypothetical protein
MRLIIFLIRTTLFFQLWFRLQAHDAMALAALPASKYFACLPMLGMLNAKVIAETQTSNACRNTKHPR